jgi:hypothetical protein
MKNRMKTTITKSLAIIAIIALQSCGGGKSAVNNSSQSMDREVRLHCSGHDFETNDGVFRASQSAISTNLSMSREKALLATKRRLSGMVNSTIKSVTDRYADDREIGGNSEFSEKVNNLTREVVKQKLRGVKKLCEKTMEKADGRYQTFIALEFDPKAILQGLDASAKLRQDYDKAKFEKIFDEEMEKLEDENK